MLLGASAVALNKTDVVPCCELKLTTTVDVISGIGSVFLKKASGAEEEG